MSGEQQERRKVRVGCRVPNGVMLRISVSGYDDGTGVRPMIHGPGVRLNGPSALHTGVGNTEGVGLEPGFTDVDAEWFAAWLAQHQLDPLVTMGQVFEEKPKDDRPTAA